MQFGTNDTTFNKVATAQFQFFNVPPGAHSVKMQFRTQVAGQTVFISQSRHERVLQPVVQT